MNAVLVKEDCPKCLKEMNLEGVNNVDFTGGREEEVLRYHCGVCRKFFNIPTRERK